MNDGEIEIEEANTAVELACRVLVERCAQNGGKLLAPTVDPDTGKIIGIVVALLTPRTVDAFIEWMKVDQKVDLRAIYEDEKRS